MVPPNFIELMKIVRQQGLSQQGYKVRGANATSVPRKVKSLSCMRNGIAGRGDAPEDDLVPWIHIAHRVAKIRLQSASRLK